MTSKNSTVVFQSLSELRRALTERGIELFRAEDFQRAQALAQANQALKEIEAKLMDVLGDGSRGLEEDALEEETYPRYVREPANVLVKIGLRRDGDATYEQKVSKSEFEEIMARLREIRNRGTEFEATDLVQNVDLPPYKSYVVLGLLQERQLLDSPRRGRYRFKGDADGWGTRLWDVVERASLVPFVHRGLRGKAS